MQEINFNEIKEWLEHGDIAALAKDFKLTRASAYNILAGRTKNFAFTEAAMTKAFANKSKILNGQERMKKLSA